MQEYSSIKSNMTKLYKIKRNYKTYIGINIER